MKELILPSIEDNKRFSVEVFIKNKNHELVFYYNERVKRWFLDILKDGKALAGGVKVLPERLVLTPFKSTSKNINFDIFFKFRNRDFENINDVRVIIVEN